jgi:hypothetical protein
LTWRVISRASDGPDGATAPTLRGARSHARQKLKVSLNIIRFPGQRGITHAGIPQTVKLADDAE